ncbi:hypothetical protein C8R43DRAFT_1234039 [Mycena crocata]|nr:hypothetical protein C8R43DRAFT_1234039 [Mycena crocata]
MAQNWIEKEPKRKLNIVFTETGDNNTGRLSAELDVLHYILSAAASTTVELGAVTSADIPYKNFLAQRYPLPGVLLSTGASLPVFPAGCTVDSAHNDSLAPCCVSVGSAPTQIDGTFGCPYTDAFVPAANQSFGACALQKGAGSSCAPADPSSCGVLQLRSKWNGAPAVLLLMAVFAALLP